MAEESKLQDMIRTSLESIRTMVDANTVVGTPIETPSGTTIIPISKVSVGYASGGLDYNGKNTASKNFGGGGGTGLSVQPVCFLAVDAAGRVDLLPLGSTAADPIDKVADLVERAPDILMKFKSVFAGKKKKKKNDEAVLDDLAEAAAEAMEESAQE